MGWDGTEVTPQIRSLIEDYHLGSIILTAKNLKCRLSKLSVGKIHPSFVVCPAALKKDGIPHLHLDMGGTCIVVPLVNFQLFVANYIQLLSKPRSSSRNYRRLPKRRVILNLCSLPWTRRMAASTVSLTKTTSASFLVQWE
jgi:hypothetical protein